jgi:membrane protease YdiL (CAAX protease family)
LTSSLDALPMNLLRKTAWILWAGLVAYIIALVLQGVWTALLVFNLNADPTLPWSVPVMAAVLLPAWMWLGGSWGPRRNSEARRRLLRATPISVGVFLKVFVAGALGIAALSGLWIVLAETVEVPTSALPDLGKYSRLMAYSLIGMGAFVGAVLEEAGFRGYAQVMLGKHFSRTVSAVLTSMLFAIGPHPPSHGFLWPKIVFYFLVALLLAAATEVASSIVPTIAVHVLGLAVFFTVIWPHDATRQLIWTGGPDSWFWIHVAQFVICAVTTVILLRQVVSEPNAFVERSNRVMQRDFC